MFHVSVIMVVGGGQTTLFWTDHWLDGKAVQDLAPAIIPFVRRRGWRRCTVRDALENNNWMQDLIGGLSVVATWQFLLLTDIISTISLQPGEGDRHI